jgi:flagellar basal body rod protein FlgG
MANLGINGITSLRTLNQWISTIDTNLTNTNRTGYKETKVSFSAGSPEPIGVQFGTLNRNMLMPATYFEVERTRINEYEQGVLNPTNDVGHFALRGTGYFVVEDKDGKRYATRDGEFHFDNDGYMVNAQGLKVLTSGQDYFRIPTSETFSVDLTGKSKSVNARGISIPTSLGTFNLNTNQYSVSKYGNKKLMVVQLPDPSRLMFSRYGFTTFELGDYLPTKIENDFKEVTDGLNPSLASPTAVGWKYENYFFHDTVNGSMDMFVDNYKTNPGEELQRRKALISAHRYTDFKSKVEFDFATGAGNTLTGANLNFNFFFGMHNATDIISRTNATDPPLPALGVLTPSIQESGIQAGIRNGNLEFRVKNGALSTGLLNGATTAIALPTAGDRLALELEADKGSLLLTFRNLTTGFSTSLNTLIPTSSYENGFHAIGTSDDFDTALAPDLNRIRIYSLQSLEQNKSTFNSTKVIGRQASYDTDPQWTNPPAGTGAGSDPQVDRYIEKTLVVHQSLELSTSTLTDSMVELTLAQKVFAAMSKIISVNSAVLDDLNNSIR